MKILFYGAGVLGSLYATRLQEAGQAEIELTGHANAARDEFKHLAGEFRSLARTKSVPIPAMDRLSTYIDPGVPLLAEGSAQIPPSWWSIWTWR